MTKEYDIPTIEDQLAECTVDQLTAELRRRGLPVIVWQPGDMEGFGNPEVSLEDRLDDCRKSLEDRLIEVGWDVIVGCIGNSPDEERPDA